MNMRLPIHCFTPQLAIMAELSRFKGRNQELLLDLLCGSWAIIATVLGQSRELD